METLGERESLLLLWYADTVSQLSAASPLPWFWLGAQESWWAWNGKARGPLLLGAMRLHDRWSDRARRRGEDPIYRPRPATVPIYFDSSAYTQLALQGEWTLTPRQYVDLVRAAGGEIGTIHHVGVQDWMCESHVLAKTGLTVADHRARTIRSFLELRDLAPEVPWVFTLQGYTADDYLRCLDEALAAGVDVAGQVLVGLGSVCRRSGTRELVEVVRRIHDAWPGLPLHGYGVKSDGVLASLQRLRSVDSAAGMMRGRKGFELGLRRELGLDARAGFAAVQAALAARLDVEVDDDLFAEWKAGTDHTTSVANSQMFAEWWRLRQQINLALEARRLRIELSIPAPVPIVAPLVVLPSAAQADRAQLELGLHVTGRADLVWADSTFVKVRVRHGAPLGEVLARYVADGGSDLAGIAEIQTDTGIFELHRGPSFTSWEQLEAEERAVA